MSSDPSRQQRRAKPWIVDRTTDSVRPAVKKEKFDFNKMKIAATSDDPVVRKAEFIEYFERFNEFPSFLFDNERSIDPRLAATMHELSEDENSSKALLDGIKVLLYRLPS